MLHPHHERARAGALRNSFPNLEAHLWLREISRVDRAVTTAPSFSWSDVVDEEGDLALPAIYCRHCTRKRFVGKGGKLSAQDVDRAIDYIRRTPAIRVRTTSPGEGLSPGRNRCHEPGSSGVAETIRAVTGATIRKPTDPALTCRPNCCHCR